MDNLGYFLLGLTVLGVGAYYFYAWNKVGRDPPGGTIVPLFFPPQGLGPAGVRYVWKQRFDDEGFAAALVGLAVKKRLVITDDDGSYSITRGGQGRDPLTVTEQHAVAGPAFGHAQPQARQSHRRQYRPQRHPGCPQRRV